MIEVGLKRVFLITLMRFLFFGFFSFVHRVASCLPCFCMLMKLGVRPLESRGSKGGAPWTSGIFPSVYDRSYRILSSVEAWSSPLVTWLPECRVECDHPAVPEAYSDFYCQASRVCTVCLRYLLHTTHNKVQLLTHNIPFHTFILQNSMPLWTLTLLSGFVLPVLPVLKVFSLYCAALCLLCIPSWPKIAILLASGQINKQLCHCKICSAWFINRHSGHSYKWEGKLFTLNAWQVQIKSTQLSFHSLHSSCALILYINILDKLSTHPQHQHHWISVVEK